MLAGCQGLPGAIVVRVMDREIDDNVDFLVVQQALERVVYVTAVLVGECLCFSAVDIKATDQVDLRVHGQVFRIAARNISAPDIVHTFLFGHDPVFPSLVALRLNIV